MIFWLDVQDGRDKRMTTVTLAEAEFPPRRVAGRGRGWYRGDCHVHSQRSHGGELTPEQLASAAREVGLDFIAITEHNTADTHGAWGSLAGDDLLVVLGQEIVTDTGHWLALGIEPGQVIDWRYNPRDGLIDQALNHVHQAGGLCVVAHPHAPYPSGVFLYPFQGFDAVEVWNGLWSSDLPWNADNEAAVAEWGRGLAAEIHHGRWRPAIGNSDVHLRGQIGTPQTVVLAEELGTGAVLAGIRAGNTWIAESGAVRLSFTARAGDRSVGIGEQLDTGGAPVVARVKVAGVPAGTVSFHTDRGAVHRDVLPHEGAGTIDWHTSAEESMFVRVEVRHSTGYMAAMTNPIIMI
ncbi:CehA/McbA family metallohydrolase [Micromonospora avicenniae]